jgi:hypothetical protein
MKRFTQAALAVATLIFSITGTVLAQEGAPPGPGPEHKKLAEMVGEYTCEMKTGDQTFKGSATFTMELGGLWLVQNFTCDMGGMKFEGRGATTYDPAKKKYVGTWIDSMAPALATSEGTMDPKTGVTTEMMDGMAGPDGKPAKYKAVSTPKDYGFDFAMYVVGADGKDTPMMTIVYRKKK